MMSAKNQVSPNTTSFFKEAIAAGFAGEIVKETSLFLLPENIVRKTKSAVVYKLSSSFAEKMGVIRFLSMCSIVWGHCLVGWESMHFHAATSVFIQSIILQIGHIGTINFFIITGYFLGDKLSDYTVLSFLRARFYTMILPWFIFLSLFVVIELFNVITLAQLMHNSAGHTLFICMGLVSSLIFHSAYWFVPMSVLSTIAIILFKKYTQSIWFGLSLAGITFFYCINLYHGWLPVNHTKSVLAYTFFIWMGIQLKANTNQVKAILDKLYLDVIVLATLVLFFIACAEGMNLKSLGSVDAFSSIRLSNCFLSILLFVLVLKTERLKWVNYLKPRTYVFGVYLVHCIVISQFTPFITKYLPSQVFFSSIGHAVLLQVSIFTVVFSVVYLLVDTIYKSRLRFVLGGK